MSYAGQRFAYKIGSPQWSFRHTVGTLVCMTLFVVGYPALLILAHDLPTLPTFRARRFFDPAGPPLFPLAEVAMGFLFIAGFVYCYTRLFAQRAPWLFFLSATALSTVGYFLGIYLTADVYPMSIYQSNYSACAGLNSAQCYPFLGYGFVLLFSTAISMFLSERLLYKWANHDVFGYPAARLRAKDVAFIFYLIVPIATYPTILMFIDGRIDFSAFQLSSLVERSLTSYFSYRGLALGIAFILIYMLVVTALFVSSNKMHFALAASVVGIGLFCLAAPIDIVVSSLIGRRMLCASGDTYACLSFWERGALLNLATVWSIVLVARSLKLSGRSTLYELVD